MLGIGGHGKLLALIVGEMQGESDSAEGGIAYEAAVQSNDVNGGEAEGEGARRGRASLFYF